MHSPCTTHGVQTTTQTPLTTTSRATRPAMPHTHDHTFGRTHSNICAPHRISTGMPTYKGGTMHGNSQELQGYPNACTLPLSEAQHYFTFSTSPPFPLLRPFPRRTLRDLTFVQCLLGHVPTCVQPTLLAQHLGACAQRACLQQQCKGTRQALPPARNCRTSHASHASNPPPPQTDSFQIGSSKCVQHTTSPAASLVASQQGHQQIKKSAAAAWCGTPMHQQ